MFVNYVNITGLEVVDKHGRMLGRPYDFLVQWGGAYPLLAFLVLSRGIIKREFAAIPWSHIKKIEENILLNVSEETLIYRPAYLSEEYISVKNGILDQQVVDTFNRKVVRVNDLHLLKVEKDLRIAHVDVGFRGLLRRLGWEKIVDIFVRTFMPRARYLTNENLISWKFVQPLEVMARKGTIRLNVPHEDLAAIPPADFSEIMEGLDPPERIALFRSLDFETQVDLLNELDVEMQHDLMEELDTQKAIRLMEQMDNDEVADLLGELSKKEAGGILALMSPAKARKLRSLLKHESDSAGGLMVTDFVSLSPDMTVTEAIDYIKNLDLTVDMIYYAYVIDKEGSLLGKVTIKKLLVAGADEKISDIMADRPVSVTVDASVKEVAFLMDKYDFMALPVVNEAKKIKGIVTVDDILAIAIDEAWGEKPGLL